MYFVYEQHKDDKLYYAFEAFKYYEVVTAC